MHIQIKKHFALGHCEVINWKVIYNLKTTYFEVILFYQYNFWIEFSISDHCDSQQVQRFAKIRRIWSNFPILACTKAELHYIMFSVCYSDTPSNQGFFKRQLFWDLPCLEENNFSPKKTVEVTFMRQRKGLQLRSFRLMLQK